MTRWADIRRSVRKASPRYVEWYIDGTVSAATEQGGTKELPQNCRLVKAVATVKTAPTDATLIVDLNTAGTTIFGATKLVIPIAGKRITQVTFDVDPKIIDSEVALTMDVDQVGSTVAGANLTVQLFYEDVEV